MDANEELNERQERLRRMMEEPQVPAPRPGNANLNPANRRGRQTRGRERNSEFIGMVSEALIDRLETLLERLDSIDDPIEYVKAYKVVQSMLPKQKEVSVSVAPQMVPVVLDEARRISLQPAQESLTSATEVTESTPEEIVEVEEVDDAPEITGLGKELNIELD